jgi:hypothetical protein
MTNKEIQVNGRIPMSVRNQVKTAQKKQRKRKTLKNKRIKKIKTPRVSHKKPPVPTTRPTNTSVKSKRGILQTGGTRNKHKTMKRVRFNLETEGIQTGKFRNVQRVKMKTSKNKRHDHSISRNKNRTLKKRGFKIRYSNETNDNISTSEEFTGDLIQNLKNVKNSLEQGVIINRV